MLQKERRDTILRVLGQNRYVSVKELVEAIGISEATVRRDLVELEQQGLLQRVRGGAEAESNHPSFGPPGVELSTPPRLPEYPLEYRKRVLLEKKKLIAKTAVSLIEDGETVIIDGGSTTYHMAEYLTVHRVQIITNSFAIADRIIKTSRNIVILTGGILYPDSEIILNPFGEYIFKHYRASKVFMGAAGIDENGVTNLDPLLIQTEREMIGQARELVILADSSKFSSSGNLFLCGFENIHTLITDNGIQEGSRQFLALKPINLLIV